MPGPRSSFAALSTNTSFRFTTWDPILLTLQIIALQSTFYTIYGFLVLFLIRLFGINYVKLGLLLDYREMTLATGSGFIVVIIWLTMGIIGSFLLPSIVARSKLVLDFVSTLHMLHLVFVSFYSKGLPNTLIWWITFVVSLATMVTLGEQRCMKKELEPIALSNAATNARVTRNRKITAPNINETLDASGNGGIVGESSAGEELEMQPLTSRTG